MVVLPEGGINVFLITLLVIERLVLPPFLSDVLSFYMIFPLMSSSVILHLREPFPELMLCS